jgi:DNA replication and repair protein RecF
LAIGTGLEPGRDGSLPRRVVRIDGRPVQGPDGARPACRGGLADAAARSAVPRRAGERRRFLDRLVTALHPEHAGDVAAYENALRQRARLLGEGNRDPHWFTALEDTMARHGVALAANRADTVQRLDAPHGWASGPFPRASLAMAGEIDGWIAHMAAIDAEDRLRAALGRQPLA